MKILIKLHLHIPLTEGFISVPHKLSFDLNSESESGKQAFCSFPSPDENIRLLVLGSHIYTKDEVLKIKQKR